MPTYSETVRLMNGVLSEMMVNVPDIKGVKEDDPTQFYLTVKSLMLRIDCQIRPDNKVSLFSSFESNDWIRYISEDERLRFQATGLVLNDAHLVAQEALIIVNNLTSDIEEVRKDLEARASIYHSRVTRYLSDLKPCVREAGGVIVIEQGLKGVLLKIAPSTIPSEPASINGEVTNSLLEKIVDLIKDEIS